MLPSDYGCNYFTSVVQDSNILDYFSFVFQVFGSVETADQIEVELRPVQEEAQHSSPVKDVPSDTTDPQQLPPSPHLSNPHPGSESTPVSLSDTTVESITQQPPVKASEAEGESKTKETSVVQDSDPTTSEVSKALEVGMSLRSAPETTNILKLEKEIHNEYFQAPPLGQTLAFQAHKREVEPLCAPTTNIDANQLTEQNPKISEMIKTCVTDFETKEAEAPACDLAEAKKDKTTEIPFEKPGSNSPVRQVLNALQSASRGSLSLSSHSRHSPDTADSDDSPSALEMEDIPAGITCVTSEDIKARPLAGLAAPPMSKSQREKMASEDLAFDHHLDTACNTSPEGTDLGLSEEEAEMENVLTEPESSEVGGVTKQDESSEEQTFSVSIDADKHKHMSSFTDKHVLTELTLFFIARNSRHVLDQLTSDRQRCQTLW